MGEGWAFCLRLPLPASLMRANEEVSMRIVKGILLGTGLFLVGSIVYLVVMIYASGARATGTTALQAWTIQNPFYWLAFVVMIGIGCLIVRARPVKT